MAEPKVAVLIAAWKAEANLARAVESALDQSVPVEVVVVDDASPDGTFAVAERLAAADPRVKAFRQPQNSGPSAARTRAMEERRAPWVTVLDSDDFMEPGRLEHLRKVADEEAADFIADDLWKVDEADINGPRSRMWSDTDLGRVVVQTPEFVMGNLSKTHGGRREMGFLKPMMSRGFLHRHGIGYDPVIRLGEDYILYTEALIAGAKFVLIDPAGYVAVVRAGSLSGKHPTESHKNLIDADTRMLQRTNLDAATRRAIEVHKVEQHKKWAWRVLIDAKRERNLGKAIGAFIAPLPVGLSLMRRLWSEVTARLPGGAKAGAKRA